MDNNDTGLSKLTNTIESVVTGIPASVRKNFFKALGQLCTAAVDIPVAWLESKSAEIRAATNARLQIIHKEGEIISNQLEIPQEYVIRASSKYAAKVIKEQLNLDDITLNAARELTENEKLIDTTNAVQDISEDWLNEFENLARLKSSEEMKFVFGKILSGEIIKPGSFSIKTVKLISQLDNEAAKLFQIFCSNAISLKIIDRIHDARMVSLNGTAGSNSLSEYGLSYDNLTILQEYGLITSDYNCRMPYSISIANEQNIVIVPIRFQGVNYGLFPIDRTQIPKDLYLSGVALTKAGKELLDIIPINPSPTYEADLKKYFEKIHLQFIRIK